MRNKTRFVFAILIVLVLSACPNGTTSSGKYAAEFRGEWIRVDTGDRWYISGSSIKVNGTSSYMSVTLEKTSENVITAKSGNVKYTLFAARTANASFNAEILLLDDVSQNAVDGRDAIGGSGKKPPIKIVNPKQPETPPLVVQPDDDGKINVPNQIPGDTLELTPDSSEWSGIKVELTPGFGSDQNMGVIPITKGDNFKVSVRMETDDITELYADMVPYSYIFELENIGTTTCGETGWTLSWNDNDFTYISGNTTDEFTHIKPGEKKQLAVRLASKPIYSDTKSKEIKINIRNYDSKTMKVRRWEDAVSINYHKARVPIRFSSEKQVQGVIKAKNGKSYYFKTTRSGDNYTATVDVPESGNEYTIVFLGATVESGSATKYSFAIDSEPPTDWDSLDKWNFLETYKPDNAYENTAPILDIATGNKSFMGYLAGDSIDYYKVKLGDYYSGGGGGSDNGNGSGSSIDIEMIQIPGGSFEMGSTMEGETPVHTVTLTGFYMAKYEVTQEQWEAVMGSNPSGFQGNYLLASGEVQDNRPVENVSWYDAIVFCNKLSIRMGLRPAYHISGSTDPSTWGSVPTSRNSTWDAVRIVSGSNGYRLPTEAQWEYAAKGGDGSPGNYTFSGSNTEDDVAWYYFNSNTTNGNVGTNATHNVGKKAANGLGLYDMSGNVGEWCWDWYGRYTSGTQTDPQGTSSGDYRVIRGGYWDSWDVRSARRGVNSPDYRHSGSGIRLVHPPLSSG